MPTPEISQAVYERRKRFRFLMNTDLRYQGRWGSKDFPIQDTGEVENISSKALAFHADGPIERGMHLRVSLAWPATLDDQLMLRLVLRQPSCGHAATSSWLALSTLNFVPQVRSRQLHARKTPRQEAASNYDDFVRGTSQQNWALSSSPLSFSLVALARHLGQLLQALQEETNRPRREEAEHAGEGLPFRAIAPEM